MEGAFQRVELNVRREAKTRWSDARGEILGRVQCLGSGDNMKAHEWSHDLHSGSRNDADSHHLPKFTEHSLRPSTNGFGRRFDVGVALDDEVTRFGICTMLEKLPLVHAVASWQLTDMSSRLVEGHRPDILILPCNGAEPEIKFLFDLGTAPDMKILMLVEDGDLSSIGRSTGVAPDGFLFRSELTVDILHSTITRLIHGELPIPSAVVRELLTRVRDHAEHTSPSPPLRLRTLLTTRERQTLELLAQGFSNKQIALRLGISGNSTKRHVANVLAKLNCPNRTMAVAWALRSGLINEDNA